MKKSLPFIAFVFSALLISCSGGRKTPSYEFTPADEIKYSIIFYIHGDGDYLYHDENNRALKADEVSLNKALSAAGELTNAEVFIFHQKRKKNFLLFFRRTDKELYYFRDGILIEKNSLKTGNENNFLDDEIAFTKNHSAAKMNPDLNSIFLYFGHQLPENKKEIYGDSFPHLKINTKSLSNGIAKIAAILNEDKFDAAILSTCLGGTPTVAKDFSKSAKNLIASPEDLHLSHMNIDYLKNLNSMENFDANNFSQSFAKDSFEIMKNKTNTIISIAVYDLNKLSGRLSALSDKNISCAEAVDSLKNMEGVKIYFRAPKFGRRQNETEHSGWNCAE